VRCFAFLGVLVIVAPTSQPPSIPYPALLPLPSLTWPWTWTVGFLGAKPRGEV